jgi:hypothetical protein
MRMISLVKWSILLTILHLGMTNPETVGQVSPSEVKNLEIRQQIEPIVIKQDMQENTFGELKTEVTNDDTKPQKTTRTATGGIIYTFLTLLTAFAFIGNGAFLIYVFWLSK